MFCQINFCKQPNVAFQPGETISGVIKYALHKPMEFERITTSLKGSGRLKVRVKSTQRSKKNTYTAFENYVDIDNIISEERNVVPVGCYEINFNFVMPGMLPSSVDYRKNLPRYTIKCRIKYYIRIKFKRPGWFAFSKRFKKEINVVSGITPQLLMEPILYAESKKLMRLFSRKNSIVTLKATILNSVVPIGGRIQINYEVNNDTNIIIKCVESKLVEVFSFRAPEQAEVKVYEDVPNTEAKTGCIQNKVIKFWSLGINLPTDRVSLQNSKLVARDYLIRITAVLPIPHRNVVLDIPVQIGEYILSVVPLAGSSTNENVAGQSMVRPITYEDAPPSYWEVMGESASVTRTDDGYDSSEFDKGEKCNSI